MVPIFKIEIMKLSYFLKATEVVWDSYHLSILCLLLEPIVEGPYCSSAHPDPFHAGSVTYKVHACRDKSCLNRKVWIIYGFQIERAIRGYQLDFYYYYYYHNCQLHLELTKSQMDGQTPKLRFLTKSFEVNGKTPF